MRVSKLKSLVLSIHSDYVKRILNGRKKYEFRGWIYRQEVEYIYIYSSNIDKKIVGRFKPTTILKGTPEEIWDKLKDESGLKKEEYFQYVNTFNYKIINAIKISDLTILTEAITPSVLSNDFKIPQRFRYLSEDEADMLNNFFEKNMEK